MKKQLHCEINWFNRLAPCFAFVFDRGEFWLCLWFVEIDIWRSY